MKLLQAALLLVLSIIIDAQPLERIHSLKARFEPVENAIYVEWSATQHRRDIPYLLRYRVIGQHEWNYRRSHHSSQKLDLEAVRNNDQVEVQVRSDDKANENWSPPLIITIQKRVVVGGVTVTDGDLLPPLDFTAHVQSPTSVRLQWMPADGANDIFYLVHVKQLTSRVGEPLHRQQIKTAATSFALGGLEPGARYEMAVRSATPEQISQTAALVEISLPQAEEFFEIGNLVISSHFLSDGHGTVNLTWQVPQHMLHRIRDYDVRFAEKGSENWHHIQFNGAQSSATLHNLRSDTEYDLEIKTTLDNGRISESNRFSFKTPKVEENPIAKVDVVVSHNVNSIQLQWILKPHIDTSNVVGYDVYINEDKDAPPHQWQHRRVNGVDGQLELAGLRSLTVYYVRIDTRLGDGNTLRAPAIYRFSTIDWGSIAHHAHSHVNPFQ